MNQVTIMGRLTRDPELSYNNNSGIAMTRFTLAVDRRLSREKKQEMESRNQPTADFIGCISWGKLAETIGRYTGKGKRVLVEGRIQTGSYVAKDGTRRYTTDVVASSVEFIDWKDRDESAQPEAPQGSAQRGPDPLPENRQAQDSQPPSGGEDAFFSADFSPVDDARIPF